MQTALQAAGHDGAMQGEGLFIKPTIQNEIDFYQWIVHQPCKLAEFVPLFMGTLHEKVPEDKPSNDPEEEEEDGGEPVRPLIVLEDLCEGFVEPSVMDVKLGSQLYDRFATPEKKERLTLVSQTTTSGSLGFRIAGVNVINNEGKREVYGKRFGREATPADIDDHLAVFWPGLKTNEHIYKVLVICVLRLRQLREALAVEALELHSSSVLLLYEGNAEALKTKLEAELNDESSASKSEEIDDNENASDSESTNSNEFKEPVDVRLIDFAHTTRSDRPDQDVLNGLDSLIAALERLIKKAESGS